MGYAFSFLPTQSGYHEIECSVWRPCGTPREEMAGKKKKFVYF